MDAIEYPIRVLITGGTETGKTMLCKVISSGRSAVWIDNIKSNTWRRDLRHDTEVIICDDVVKNEIGHLKELFAIKSIEVRPRYSRLVTTVYPKLIICTSSCLSIKKVFKNRHKMLIFDLTD